MNAENYTIRVLIKEPNKDPVDTQIIDYYKDLQKVVGGLIEFVPSGIDGIDIIINEEGLLLELEPNLYWVYGKQILVGTLIFVRVNYDTGELQSLTDEDVDLIKKNLLDKIFLVK